MPTTLSVVLASLTATAVPPPSATAIPTQVASLALEVIGTAEATPTVAAAIDIVATVPITPTATPSFYRTRIVGYSTQQHLIEAHMLGWGHQKLMLVGGIHGGYEWNTIVLSYELLDYLLANQELIPDSVQIIIVPSANPDGQVLVAGQNGRFAADAVSADTVPGRFNSNGVDLNRNWDCGWQPTGIWRQQSVSGGDYPFSEIENQHLRYFIENELPELVIFYHSAAPGIFFGGCDGDVLGETRLFGEMYAEQSGYPVYNGFSAYPITGDASNYLSTKGIPSFGVELNNHRDTDLPQNIAGVLALMAYLDVDGAGDAMGITP